MITDQIGRIEVLSPILLITTTTSFDNLCISFFKKKKWYPSLEHMHHGVYCPIHLVMTYTFLVLCPIHDEIRAADS